MSHEHNPTDELSELRRQARVNQLRLKIAQQNAALGAAPFKAIAIRSKTFYDPTNYFNPRDYLFETPPFSAAPCPPR